VSNRERRSRGVRLCSCRCDEQLALCPLVNDNIGHTILLVFFDEAMGLF
jgi:hypothetical protein